MLEYSNLITCVNDKFDIKLGLNRRGLGMVGHDTPVSITEPEFHFINWIITKNDLKRGFEVATAFGVSALAAGLAFKQTGGRLVTMDAYIEEQHNQCDSYKTEKATYQNADGYRLANFLFKEYEVPVVAEIGWSPDDTDNVIKKNFGDEKLDFVFIDAGHWDSALQADVAAIIPYLAEKYILFIHDHYCFGESTKQFFQEKFGKLWTPVFDDTILNYGLSFVSNI